MSVALDLANLRTIQGDCLFQCICTESIHLSTVRHLFQKWGISHTILENNKLHMTSDTARKGPYLHIVHSTHIVIF
jgi:hypothetical protein